MTENGSFKARIEKELKTRRTIYKAILVLCMLYLMFNLIKERSKLISYEYKMSNTDVQRQIKELDEISKNLNNLQFFIANQKERIISQEKAIADLSAEKDKLEPLVKTQREAIESLFQLQEKRQKSYKWLDITIGFSLGIVSSMIASIFLDLLRKRKKKV